nr:uncharacterized protein LOC109175178 [Ipomoea trifida]
MAQENPAMCVREMGMGNILDLNITNIPRKLGLWLVENFDPRSCTLQLQNGQSIHITAADVAATLGLPMGQIEITKRAARAVPEILREWRAIFEKTTACITPAAMITRMLETDAGDPWFKRHFALLVITVLIDPMVNGYVNQNYIGHLHDVDNIPNLNWCQLVINSLVASKISWQRSADKIFGGPIVFLTVFYADRVVLYRRTVPRSYPAFRSWTFKLLSMRQQAEIKSGGFGFGYIDSPLEMGNAPPEEAGPSIPYADVPPQPEPREQNPRLPEGLEEEQTHSWDDINAVAREYSDAEQRQEGDAVEVNVDGCEAELGEEIPQAAERPQQIRTEIPAPSDEVTPDQAPPASSSEPPPEIQAKENGKRPVLEYSPLRPRQPLPIIDISAPINATEEAVRKWVLDNPNPDMNRELFRFQSRVILWEDMLLLKPNGEIPTSIIDAWAAILNDNEDDRLSSRFFASTWTTLYTVVDPLGEEDERFKKFTDNYLVDKSFAVETEWKNIQHFLFPIIASQHYYMIHFDPLCERFEAIDNSSKVCKTDDNYGIVPTTLQKFLSMFLTGLKSTYKSEKIAKLKLKRIKMTWRDNKNKVDCGVFLMRHMETFRGQLPELWDCGLEKENKDQLNVLRIKYLTALVMSDVNEHKARNIQAAAEFGLEN